MGCSDIYCLARDLGWAGGSHCASLGQSYLLEYAWTARRPSRVVGDAAVLLVVPPPYLKFDED